MKCILWQWTLEIQTNMVFSRIKAFKKTALDIRQMKLNIECGMWRLMQPKKKTENLNLFIENENWANQLLSENVSHTNVNMHRSGNIKCSFS